MTQPKFNERIRAKGHENKRTTNGYCWVGIGLDAAFANCGDYEAE